MTHLLDVVLSVSIDSAIADAAIEKACLIQPTTVRAIANSPNLKAVQRVLSMGSCIEDGATLPWKCWRLGSLKVHSFERGFVLSDGGFLIMDTFIGRGI